MRFFISGVSPPAAGPGRAGALRGGVGGSAGQGTPFFRDGLGHWHCPQGYGVPQYPAGRGRQWQGKGGEGQWQGPAGAWLSFAWRIAGACLHRLHCATGAVVPCMAVFLEKTHEFACILF